MPQLSNHPLTTSQLITTPPPPSPLRRSLKNSLGGFRTDSLLEKEKISGSSFILPRRRDTSVKTPLLDLFGPSGPWAPSLNPKPSDSPSPARPSSGARQQSVAGARARPHPERMPMILQLELSDRGGDNGAGHVRVWARRVCGGADAVVAS
jgi:hypothetical protein